MSDQSHAQCSCQATLRVPRGRDEHRSRAPAPNRSQLNQISKLAAIDTTEMLTWLRPLRLISDLARGDRRTLRSRFLDNYCRQLGTALTQDPHARDLDLLCPTPMPRTAGLAVLSRSGFDSWPVTRRPRSRVGYAATNRHGRLTDDMRGPKRPTTRLGSEARDHVVISS